jgi:uncharacterized membrane protein
MVIALTGMYAICRLYFSRERAIVGTLAVAAHPMVVAQMFEVRFYGAWLAASVWFVFAILVPATGRNRWPIILLRIALAVAVATIHWFGLAVVALVVAADMTLAARSPKERLARIAPFLFAAAATAACLPFLAGQRAGLTVPTWIEPTTGLSIARLAYRIFVNPWLLVVAAYAAARLATRARPERVGLAALPPFMPLLSLLLFPAVITVFSLTVQPVLYERYVIVVVAPLAILAAWAALPSGRTGGTLLAAVASVGLVFALGREMRRYNALTAITDWRVRNAIAATARVVARGGPLPVVFARRFEQYPVVQQRPDLAPSVAFLDFDGVPSPSLMRRTVFERDMARRVARFYHQYRLIGVDSLRARGPFVVITSANEEDELRRLLEGFEIVPQGADVYYVHR